MNKEEENGTKTFCKVHTNERAEFFCCQHSMMLCQECYLDEHQQCSPVLPVEDVLENFKNGAALESIENCVRKLNSTLDDMTSKKESNIEDVKQKKQSIKRTIQEAKQKICAYLDKLVTSLEIEIDEKCNKIVERIRKDRIKIMRKKDELMIFLNDISKAKKEGSKIQLLEGQDIQKLQKSQHQMEERIKSLENDDKYLDIHLKLSDPIFAYENVFPNFGSAVISEKSMKLHVDAKRVTNGTDILSSQKFEIQIQNSINNHSKGVHVIPGKLVHVSTFPTSVLGKGVKIFRACFLPDNTLLLAGYQEKTLYVCNKNGKECKRIRVANFPGGVALYNNSCALVSAWQHGIQRIDLKTQKASDKIKLRGECSAIATYANKICIKNSDEHLTVIDLYGKILTKMPTMFNPWEIYLTNTGCVYYSNLQNNDVHCVFPDGSNYITYSCPELMDPAGLAVDNQECLYISGSRSNNIHRISGDRERKEIVLSSEDGLRSPSGMAFNRQTDELLIVNEEFSSIRIYRVTSSES